MEIKALYDSKEMTIEMAMDFFSLIEESIEPEDREEYNELAESLEGDFLKTNNEEENIFTNWKTAPNNLMMTKGFRSIFKNDMEALWAAYLSIGLVLGGIEWFGKGDGRASALQPFFRFGREYWVKCQRDGIVFLLPEEY